ncbi:MAG: MFS transporter [Armatimonadetes bacterium]|nr:MFS transporter [Armatimonadota bacterium]
MNAPTSDIHASYDKTKLFLLSVIALVTAGMAFSIRGGITSDLQKVFFESSDPTHAAARVTAVTGAAFLGFAISVLVGSPLCDSLGMGKLLGLSAALFAAGIGGTLVTPPGEGAQTMLWVSMFGMGLAHGLVEAVINPLIATLYPKEKTHKLNVLHSWWPGGIIIGGLISASGIGWKTQLILVLIPAIAFGVMLLGTKFPPTERVAAGVSSGEMFKEALRPLFIVFFLLMFLTASTELAPGQWVDAALTRTVGFRGILLLVYVSGLMFVMRYFAGPLAHKLSPIGLLWLSSLLAGIGLFMLATANSTLTGLLAATVWGVGVCYMWPTMLAVTSERFPKGGAFLMGIMGSAGNLAIFFVLPKLGQIFDEAKLASAKLQNLDFSALQEAAKTDTSKASTLNTILSSASETSFKAVAMIPIVLVIVFALVWLYDKSKGGYKAERLDSAE